MAQRITQLFRLFYGVESTEGTEVLGTAAEAILTAGVDMTLDQTLHARKFIGQLGNYTGKIGGQPAPALSFSTELRNRGATNNVPDIDELLKTCFGTRTLDTVDTTCSAGCTTTVLQVADSSGATAGNAIAIETSATSEEYEIGWIQSVDSGTQITLTTALSFTPADTAKVKPSLTYAPAASGHQSLSFQVWLDATDYVSFLGCKGSLTIEIPEPGAIPMANWTWSALRWLHTTSGTRPAQTIGDSGGPPVAIGSNFKIDATQTDVRAFTMDLGQTIGRKKSHNSTKGTAAQVVSDRTPRWTLGMYDVDQAQFTGWNAGTEVELSHQFGNTVNNMVALQVGQAQRDPVGYGDDEGLTTNEIEGQASLSSGNDEMRVAML